VLPNVLLKRFINIDVENLCLTKKKEMEGEIMMSKLVKVAALSLFFAYFVAVSGQENLVLNPGFEEGTGEYPDNWNTYIQSGDASYVSFSWVSDVVHSGSKSVCIVHTDSAMSSFYQKVPVKPNYIYKVSGYIKTQGVEAGANWWEGGAQLRVDGDVTGNWWDNMTSRLYGDNDWTYVELEVTTTEDADTIEVHCKLGEGFAIKGTAWYDDISVTEVKAVGQWFENGDFETGDPTDPSFPKGWYVSSNSSDLGTATLDETVFHGGSKSLKLTRPLNKDGEIMLQQDKGPEPVGLVDGARYKFSGWIKTQGVPDGGRGACFITAWDNHTIGNTALHGDNDWTYIEEIVTYKETGWGAWRIYLGIDSSATSGECYAWFDDVNIEFIGIPPGAPSNADIEYRDGQITLTWEPAQQNTNPIAYYIIEKIAIDDTTGNIISNPGFEIPNSDFSFPDGWYTWDWGSSPATTFTWETSGQRSGDFCVSAETDSNGWGMIYTSIYPSDLPLGEPGVVLLRGFVKTQDVSGGHGAYIGFGYGTEITDGIFGTNDYIKVYDYAYVDAHKYLCCLLGRLGEKVKGKAWFDDVTVTPFKQIGQTSSNSFVDTDVISDTVYVYAIRTVDTKGLVSEPVTFEADLRLPERVTLVSPEDGVRIAEPVLEWERVLGADGYYVEVKKSGSVVWSADNVTENHVVIPEDVLQDDSTYTWTVQYVVNGTYSDLSEERSFIYTKWPEEFLYISDSTAVFWKNGWGDGNIDKSNDGNPITIGGKVFEKGLGLHAPAKVVYNIPANVNCFMAYIGHDDEAAGGNGVIFKVVVNEDTLFVSEPKCWGDPAELIRVYFGEMQADSLQLIIDEIGGDMGYDHADWAMPILYKKEEVGIDEDGIFVPMETRLIGNYPNPFNPTTKFVFDLASREKVTISIYNILGQEVAKVVDKVFPAGRYEVIWNINETNLGKELSSGVYFCRMKAGDYVNVRKIMILK